MIMESKKPHGLLSTSWKTRKGSGVVQPKSKGLRDGDIDPKGRRRETSQLKQRVCSYFLQCLVLFRPLTY